MLTEQKNIKDHLLEKLSFFNNGFAHVYLDGSAEMMISEDGQNQIAFGIDDRLGNYFYIRSAGNIKISKGEQITSCIGSLILNNELVMVADVQGMNAENVLKCLLNALGIYKGAEDDLQITSAIIAKDKIITSEFPFLKSEKAKEILARIGHRTLVKITFNNIVFMQPNDRECYECKPCTDCP